MSIHLDRTSLSKVVCRFQFSTFVVYVWSTKYECPAGLSFPINVSLRLRRPNCDIRCHVINGLSVRSIYGPGACGTCFSTLHRKTRAPTKNCTSYILARTNKLHVNCAE
jgi:hypothetical protein